MIPETPARETPAPETPATPARKKPWSKPTINTMFGPDQIRAGVYKALTFEGGDSYTPVQS